MRLDGLIRVGLLAGALAACVATASCTNSVTSPSSTAPYSQVDLLMGNGDVAASGQVLTVNYTGWLYDPTKPDNKGLQFDTSVGRDPFVFTLGTS